MRDNLGEVRRQQIATDSTLGLMKRQTEIIDSTLGLMRNQTNVLTEESIRRFRPFPIITVRNPGTALLTYGIQAPDSGTGVADVSSVPRESPAWDHRRAVVLAVTGISFEIKNNGASPLYVTGADIGGIKSSEWIEKHNKSEESVCREALEKSTFWHPDIDMLVMPSDSTIIPPREARAIRSMDVKTFDTYLRKEAEGLPFYVYCYIQYQDLYSRTYDAIWMTTYIFHFEREENAKGEYIDKVSLRSPFREKMRWDVLCPGDSCRPSY